MTIIPGHSSNKAYPWQQQHWQRLTGQFHKGQLAHAYLVCGEKGIGKFHLIRSFARYLLCLNQNEQGCCEKCINCALSVHGHHPDILSIEPEAGGRDIKVDQIRAMIDFAVRTSHSGIAKLVLINQAHHLNLSAANSLLKSLEEPANDTFLFLISARPGSLPATLRSRCQRLLLQTPTFTDAVTWLQDQGVGVSQASSLATAAGNRPLYAWSLARHDGTSDAQDFIDNLTRLMQGQMTIQAAVAAAMKLEDSLAIEYLLSVSTIVIRSLLTKVKDVEAPTANLVGVLRTVPVPQILLHRRLLAFNAEVGLSLRQLHSGTNPNLQLLLESLLWQWSRLGAESRRRA